MVRLVSFCVIWAASVRKLKIFQSDLFRQTRKNHTRRYFCKKNAENNMITYNKATLYQERAVFGKMKMDPAKWAQTQNAGEISSLQWFFSQSIELMMDKVWLQCIRPMLLK
jgi:hypothetical protein